MSESTDRLSAPAPCFRPLSQQKATALRRLIHTTSRSHPGVPWGELVSACEELAECPLELDASAARLIGVPVIVLRANLPSANQPVFEKLSARERDVARLLAAGYDNANISRTLGISIGTVKDHVHHALTKTGMKSRTALAAALAREGV